MRAAIRAYHQERDLIRQNEQLRQMNSELETLVNARTLELVEKNRELEILSVTDKLTGLANRRKLDQVLDEELIRARRYGVEFSVAIMDIDHFKRVNDTYGHSAGDLVLEAMARILRQCTRDADLVARMGGEEFVVVCRHAGIERCQVVAEKIRVAIEAHDFSGIGRVTASFGVAVFDKNDSIASLMARADVAVYRAKAGGRNRVETSHEPG